MDLSEKVLNLKTLIVEDNSVFRKMLKEKLQLLFPAMVIYEAAEGSEALQEVDTLKPELIFMDIRLPGESGIQLTQKIKTKYPNTKIIFLTSHDSPEYREAAIRSGGVCYVPKDSLDYMQLEKLVRSFIE